MVETSLVQCGILANRTREQPDPMAASLIGIERLPSPPSQLPPIATRNFQSSLVAGIRDYLDVNQEMFESLNRAPDATPDKLPGLGNLDRIFEAPPDSMIAPQALAEPWKLRQGRKIDYVRRDSANRRLGRLGEEFAVELEQRRLSVHGRDDLAGKVELVSDTRGDGLGFDILSFDEVDDSEGLVEVKTTTQGKYFPFYLTASC